MIAVIPVRNGVFPAGSDEAIGEALDEASRARQRAPLARAVAEYAAARWWRRGWRRELNSDWLFARLTGDVHLARNVLGPGWLARISDDDLRRALPAETAAVRAALEAAAAMAE